MAANSRVTIAAHALAWLELARQRGRPWMTSDEVAASVKTNPVILRRSLGDLHKAGLVRSRRGSGFSLARPAGEISMLDVWNAVSGEPLPARTDDTEPFRAALARRTIAGILERILSPEPPSQPGPSKQPGPSSQPGPSKQPGPPSQP